MTSSVLRGAADVLLVEDDPGDVMMTRDTIEDCHLDLTLHVVGDGEKAMRFLRRTDEFAGVPRPALVLLDLNLPRRSGLEVLAELRADPDPEHYSCGGPHYLAGRGRCAWASSTPSAPPGHWGCTELPGRDRARRGRWLRLCGLVTISGAGLLGSHLAFRTGHGASHGEEIPHVIAPGWHNLMKSAVLPEGKPVRQLAGGGHWPASLAGTGLTRHRAREAWCRSRCWSAGPGTGRSDVRPGRSGGTGCRGSRCTGLAARSGSG